MHFAHFSHTEQYITLNKIDHQRELQFIATGSKHNYHTCKYCTFVKRHVTCAHPHITGDGARCVASALATKGFMVDGSPSSTLHARVCWG